MTDTTHQRRVAVELLPCPFCGGDGLLHRVPGLGKVWAVTCVNCDARPSGALGANGKGAIPKWNTRTATRQLEELRAENARIREEGMTRDDVAMLREVAQQMREALQAQTDFNGRSKTDNPKELFERACKLRWEAQQGYDKLHGEG